MTETTGSIDPSRPQFDAFKALPRNTPIQMLNLIRLRPLAAYPADLSAKAEAVLCKLGVEVHTGTRVTGVGPGWVEAEGKVCNGRMDAAVTLWAAGVQASPLGKMLGAPLDRRGCVVVDDRLNPPGLPEIFVLGDLAHLEQDGRQVPGVAQPAMQMGDHVARMLEADLKGAGRPAFRYFDKGDMATIGRMAAVANVEWPFKAHMSGFPAWVTWLTVHIFFLIGFRNRFSVFVAWIWTYFTFTRGARLIIGDQRLPGWQEQLDAEAVQSSDPSNPAKKQSAAESGLLHLCIERFARLTRSPGAPTAHSNHETTCKWFQFLFVPKLRTCHLN